MISASEPGSLITIEPNPTKMGGGPSSSHAISGANLDSSKSELTWSCVKAPTTRAKSGQSLGLGTNDGDHMYENGTRSRVSSEPASVPMRICLSLSTCTRHSLIIESLPTHMAKSHMPYDA